MSTPELNTPEHELFRDTVRKFVQEELRPRAREFDAAGRFDRSLYKKMGDLGLLGLRYEPGYGGAGLDWSYSAVFYEELGRADNAGVTMGITVHTDMATPSLAEFGSDELKRAYLAPSIAGEMISAIAVTVHVSMTTAGSCCHRMVTGLVLTTRNGWISPVSALFEYSNSVTS